MNEKRNWKSTCHDFGFKFVIFVNTTEERLHDYIETEIPAATSYTGATDQEIEAARTLQLPVYLY